jgi:fatty-acyl-CoA synthase
MSSSRNNTLGKLFNHTAELKKDKTFLIFEDKEFTYAEAKAMVDAIAKGLLRSGFEKGNHIALWMSNSPVWVFVQQAVLKIGGVLIVLNTHIVSREMFYMLRQSEAVGLIFERNIFEHDFLEMLKEMSLDSSNDLSSGCIKETLPLLRVMIGVGDHLPNYVIDFNDLLRRGDLVNEEELRDAEDRVHEDDMAMMLYTSGTTGAPKGVLLQHKSIYMRCTVFAEWFGLTENDIGFYAQPLYHIAGCLAAIENAIVTGGCVCCQKRFDVKKSLADIEQYRCSMFYCVPTVLAELLHHPDFGLYDFSAMRVGIVSGAPVSPALVKEAKERFIPQLLAGYGSTECCAVVTATNLNDTVEIVSTRVGVPTPYCEVRIFDLESGAELLVGEEGEICVRSEYNMACYYKEDKATRETIDKNGFLHTGDMGFFDDNGYLSLTGRKNDMIIVGGVNVYPVEVEEVLDSYEGIEQSQVVAVADAKLGEVPFAFVILKNKSDEVDAEGLYRFCRKMLSSYKVPKYMKCVEAFPMTVTRKPMKKELRKHAQVSDDCIRLF